MATTANHHDSKFATEPDEDIAAIAKQISDHAEAIYQTWKARGLAPNEILTCHNNINAVDKFGSVLTPPSSQSQSQQQLQNSAPKSAVVVELLCSSSPAKNHLEQFVNKFVVEDKASRLASRQSKPFISKNYPSSIQHALEKFEKSPGEMKTVVKSVCVPNSKNHHPIPAAKPSSFHPKIKSQLYPNEKTFPAERIIPISNAPTMVVGSDGVDGNKSPVKGNTAWPLKSKIVSFSESDIKTNGSSIPNDKKCTEFLDEVAKEEEKLINALKSGVIIENEFKQKNFDQKGAGISNNNLIGLKSAAEVVKIKEQISGNFNQQQEDVKSLEKVTITNSQSTPRRAAVRNFKNSNNNSENNLDTSQSRSNSNLKLLNPLNNNSSADSSSNPVRPFLTRGSVAERVLIFEKCPTEIIEKQRSRGNTTAATPWKPVSGEVHNKIQTYSKEVNHKNTSYPPHTTLQRHTKANKNVFIPKFHYPHGKPVSQREQNSIIKTIKDAFQLLPNMQAAKEQFSHITKACELPLYWKAPLFIACGGEKLGYVDVNVFLDYWKELSSMCHDDASRFMKIITRSPTRLYILPEDLIPLVQDVVNTHPGLTFLKQAPEFHSRYVHTVICRIYYCVNQSWSGQISLAELKKSDILRAIHLLEEEEDINQVTAYFSYEHFYVIYCKFWELDRDHDLYINKEDLARHSDRALSTRIIDRIFSVFRRSKTRNSMLHEGKMSYTDFVIFLLAEEDKRHPRAIEYWFRCMDLDGDGYLSMYELEYFYDEQLQRMEAMGIECLPFEDCLCQMLDMIQPKIPGKISLSDLKRCKMTPIFFDTFFNLEKYLDHEQRDPFASQRDHENDMSDWERYAAEEYELLVAEEGGNMNNEDMEGDYRVTEPEEEEDLFSCNLDDILNGPTKSISFVKNGSYIVENYNYQPSMVVTDYSDEKQHCPSDSSEDYAADSDDCSI